MIAAAVLAAIAIAHCEAADEGSKDISTMPPSQIPGHVPETNMIKNDVVAELDKLIEKLERAKTASGDQMQARQEEIQRLQLLRDYNQANIEVRRTTIKEARLGIDHAVALIDAKIKNGDFDGFLYFGEYTTVSVNGKEIVYVSNMDIMNITQLAASVIYERKAMLSARAQILTAKKLDDPDAIRQSIDEIRMSIQQTQGMNDPDNSKLAKMISGVYSSDLMMQNQQNGAGAYGGTQNGQVGTGGMMGGTMEEPYERMIALRKGGHLGRALIVSDIQDDYIQFKLAKGI